MSAVDWLCRIEFNGRKIFKPAAADGSKVSSAHNGWRYENFGGCDGVIEDGVCQSEARTAQNSYFLRLHGSQSEPVLPEPAEYNDIDYVFGDGGTRPKPQIKRRRAGCLPGGGWFSGVRRAEWHAGRGVPTGRGKSSSPTPATTGAAAGLSPRSAAQGVVPTAAPAASRCQLSGTDPGVPGRYPGGS